MGPNFWTKRQVRRFVPALRELKSPRADAMGRVMSQRGCDTGVYSGFAAPEASLDAVSSARRLELPPRIRQLSSAIEARIASTWMNPPIV
jgi:hypothetical protein